MCFMVKCGRGPGKFEFLNLEGLLYQGQGSDFGENSTLTLVSWHLS